MPISFRACTRRFRNYHLVPLITALTLSAASVDAQVAADVWTNRYNESSTVDAVALGIAVATNGDVVVVGTGVHGNAAGYVTLKYSAAGVPLWTNFYSGPAGSYAVARCVAMHKNGNVFVTGYSSGSMTPTELVTVAYSGAGKLLWTAHCPPARPDYPQQEVPAGIAVDANGDVFVTGRSFSRFGDYDYVTLKLSGAYGGILWTNYFGKTTGSKDVPSALAVDASGNVYVTGSSGGGYATIKYSGASGAPLRTMIYSDYSGAPAAMAVDATGGVVVTGFIDYTFSGPADTDYLTIKYSGVNGAELWSRSYWGPQGAYNLLKDQAVAVAIGTNGTVFVTGYSSSTNTGINFMTLAYSGTTGNSLWERRYVGPARNDRPTAIAVAPNGNVIVTGYSLSPDSTNDFATVAYSGTTGEPLWTNRYNGPGNGSDEAYALAVDASGNAIVTGASVNSGKADFATIKYSPLSSASPIRLTSVQLAAGVFTASFTNTAGILFTALATTNLATPPSNWASLGTVIEIAPGQFQFTDSQATNEQRFYRIRSP